MKEKVLFTCPHCSFVNQINLTVQKGIHTELFTCDAEDGGCGGLMVVSISFKIKSTCKIYNLSLVTT